jgi:hypothetical protein
MKVAFYPDPELYSNLLSNQIPDFLESKIFCVSNYSDADFIVCWDAMPLNLMSKFNNKKFILIGAEPPHINNTNFDKLDYFDFVVNYPPYISDFLPAIWWINKDYKYLKNLTLNKSKLFSCVVSNKWRKRTNFVKTVSKQIDDLEVWGRWHYDNSDKDFTSSTSYMGEINGKSGPLCKSGGLLDYHYSLCLENCSVNNYWTEKIVDSFLCWSMPIYYGAKNIFDYFPEESLHQIDMSRESIKDIKKIIKNTPDSDQIKAMSHARNMILDKYNVWSIVYNLIKDGDS